jgi:hypothetical protein
MSKARVGTGELTPFKKGDTGSESIGGSTSKEHVREGFMPNVNINKASREESELTPFKTGPTGPGVNRGNPGVPAAREKSDSGIPNPHGYKAFKE